MKVIKPPVYIETDRLILRTPVFKDAEMIYRKYAADLEVTKYLVWSPHNGLDETITFINRCLKSWDDGTAFPYTIALKSNDQVIGMIEIRAVLPKAEVGYVSSREYWGNGYMTEALIKIIDTCFANPAIHRVFAMCDTENFSSRRILQKAGMHLEGIMKSFAIFPFFDSEPRDCCCYAITRKMYSQ